MTELADAMEEMERLDCPAEHLFCPGMYARVLKMPAGSLIISKIHKTEHFCVALDGVALVVIGDSHERVVGPRLMVTMPGAQRALYIIEEATWVTFHPTEKTDVDEIEKDIIAETWDDPELIEYMKRGLLEK